MTPWFDRILRDTAVKLGLPVRCTARRLRGPVTLFHGSPFHFDTPDPALFEPDAVGAAESPGLITHGRPDAALERARTLRPLGLPAYLYTITLTDLSGWLEPGLSIGSRRHRRLRELCQLEGDRITAILSDSGPHSDGPYLYRRFVDAVGAPRASRLFSEAGMPGLLEFTGEGNLRVQRAVFFSAAAVPPLSRSLIDAPDIPPAGDLPPADRLAQLLASPARRFALESDPAYRAAVKSALWPAGSAPVSLAADQAIDQAIQARASAARPVEPFELPADAAALARLVPDDDQGPVQGGITRSVRLVRDPVSGRRLVLKRGANAQALREEYLANRIYHALGVRVPAASLIETAEGPRMVLEFIAGETMDKAMASRDLRAAAALRQTVAADFAIDALLGNYDAGSRHDLNIMVTATGECVRIDQGAALRYNALGGLKPVKPWQRLYRWGSPWNSDAGCFDMLREPGWFNRRAVANYARLTDGEILQRLQRAAADFPKVEAIAPPEVSAMLKRRLVHAIARFEKGATLRAQTAAPSPGARVR